MSIEYEISEVNMELESSDQVYVEIPRETTSKIFKEKGQKPINAYSEEDDSYVSGELQFIFEKETDNLQELLLAPVYKEDDGFTNGDFIIPPDYIFDDEELNEDVVSHLIKERQSK